ncbi:AAA family ATPase [Spirulina sp. 06S082]|uniref:AAA family ATPase n=1 Tax=Spirulina sp. 06S082 TaxID=3110248 RepID=UPI002B1F7EFF|nr:AAA family ATPase [Spirulina sp. 06S082]MEA5467946.1 AAA family ATPase [Spirulina sp. 06S082]
MSKFIKHLEAIGVHGRFDIGLSFKDGINIIHGSNGTGKTTLLHILANAVNGDFERFVHLKFNNLTITLDDDTSIYLEQDCMGDLEDTKTTIWINKNRNPDPIVSYQFRDLLEKEKEEEDRYRQLSLFDSLKESNITLEATYFPAFRTMIEAWATLDENDIRGFFRRSPNFRKILRSATRSTDLARTLFGQFVPKLEYPSPLEIEERINSELIEAQLKIASIDRDLLSDAFVESFKAISQSQEIENNLEEPDEIIEKIKVITESLQNLPFQINVNMPNDVYERLRKQLNSFQLEPESENIAKRVLSVYKNSLQKRLDEQTDAYSSIETYLESVNEFLERKKLEIHATFHPRRPQLGVKIGDEKSIDSLQVLSSGERQIVGLIYAASHMTNGRVVLIDEPEISLHIDWQRKLLPEMMKQLGDKQLIICTHSPIVASQYRDRMIELELKPTSNPNLGHQVMNMEREYIM